jgi:hypothetical protein
MPEGLVTTSMKLAEQPRAFIHSLIRSYALASFPITMVHALWVADLP